MQTPQDAPADKATIVLHPGSTHLHIGLSTDPTPHTIPHVIAYRRKGEGPIAGGGVVSDQHGEGLNSSKRKGYVDESLVLKHCNEITVSEL